MEKQKRTYYTRAQMVSFGNYLLSEGRKTNMQIIRAEQNADIEDINAVTAADFANWAQIQSGLTV